MVCYERFINWSDWSEFTYKKGNSEASFPEEDNRTDLLKFIAKEYPQPDLILFLLFINNIPTEIYKIDQNLSCFIQEGIVF